MPRSARRTAVEPALEDYRRKRDFGRTREPAGDRRPPPPRKAGKPGGGVYVVQKHHASRLHYDFRLEHQGVLLSWAVPKGPSLDPAVRRLAVRVEDHPLDYAKFEGTIPAGNYGAGKVAIWDQGRWKPEEPVASALDRGRLDFDLRGGRLAGSWRLVRMDDGARDAAKNWLLMRRSGADGDISPALNGKAKPAGRSRAARASREAARSSRAPEATLAPEGQLELATLVESPPEGAAWLHETKWDGYRMLAVVAAGRCRIWSRSGLEWTARVQEIASPLAGLPVRNAVIDGELIALAGRRSRFERLQAALGDDARPADRRALRFVAFDLLVLDGEDLRAQPLVERRERLSRILAGRPTGSPIRFSRASRGGGERQLALACSRGEEGILSKLADSPYRPGRGRDWQKSRCHARDELVIVGYTPGRSQGAGGLGALVLATRESPGGPLVAAGKVGTGFDATTRAGLLRKLKALETGRPQFEGGGEELRDARWVRPALVAEIRFTEWTRDGRLRHPAFLGLRADRSAADVRRERPVSDASKIASKGPGSPRKASGTEPTVAGVRISHPDRIVFPGTAVSKLELARYFDRVWPWMEPHLVDRPLAFVRCPAGAGSTCFFQKHLDEALPGIAPVDVSLPREKPDVQVRVESREGLVALAQRGVVELHLWGSRARRLERPDRLVFDLDPGDGVPWREVVAAARRLHRLLGDLGLRSFALLSGGKGVHVVVPVGPAVSWDSFKAVAAEIASAMERADPDRFVARAAKKERAGRIFVDYLRNGRGATAIAPYSPRARAGAPVAMPIAWPELARSRPDRWTIRTALRRLASKREDPWPGYFDPCPSLEPAARAILGRAGVIGTAGKTGRKGMATRKGTSRKRYGKLAEKKVERAMHEMKRGELESGGSGKKVTSRKQAIAIGLSEARAAGGKVPPAPRKRVARKK